MDAKTHKELMALQLEHVLEIEAKEMTDAIIASPSRGLADWIKTQDIPFADANAKADIEGRNRPARTFGGITGKEWYRGPSVGGEGCYCTHHPDDPAHNSSCYSPPPSNPQKDRADE